MAQSEINRREDKEMKKPILLIAMVPIELVLIFIGVEQLTGSQETAWRMVGIVGGISIMLGLVVFLAQKLNKPN